ncbi:MAG: glycosyltransferase family 4 protein [Candidatus Korobacteraceae bacterium]
MNRNQEQLPRSSEGAHVSAALNGTRTRVLTVLPDFPFPATTGLHLRNLSNLELVHRLGCCSALLYFTTEEREPPAIDTTPVARICDEVRHGGRRFPHANFSTASLVLHKADFLLRGGLGWAGKRYPFSMSYDRIGAEKIILAEARGVKADFVVLPSMFMHYTTKLRQQGFQVIIDAADVLTNLSASFMENLEGRGGRLGLYANYLACRSQERIFLRECSELWTTSAVEAEEFRRIAGNIRVLVVPNSLDETAVQPASANNEPIVGFIGTYSYAPNLHAALFLAEQVFPQVLRELPDAVLRIAGANMPDSAITRLQGLPHVEILGQVADSGQFMDECAVLALPVFLRGGVPLKLVEAMARGKAIVASPELIGGLDFTDGETVLMRTKPEDFASAIVTLLRNLSLRERLGSNARATFVRDFSMSSAEAILRRDSVLMERCLSTLQSETTVPQ